MGTEKDWEAVEREGEEEEGEEEEVKEQSSKQAEKGKGEDLRYNIRGLKERKNVFRKNDISWYKIGVILKIKELVARFGKRVANENTRKGPGMEFAFVRGGDSWVTEAPNVVRWW